MIEKANFINLLRAKGIRQDSRSWDDYERAKDFIETLCAAPEDYDRFVKITIDFLRL